MNMHYFASVSLKRLVRAVAIGRRLRVLTLTQRHFFRFVDRELERLEPGPFVRPIAEWLVPRSSTRAPVIRSCF